MAFRSA